jgi:hypothetical protein
MQSSEQNYTVQCVIIKTIQHYYMEISRCCKRQPRLKRRHTIVEFLVTFLKLTLRCLQPGVLRKLQLCPN